MSSKLKTRNKEQQTRIKLKGQETKGKKQGARQRSTFKGQETKEKWQETSSNR